MRTKVILICVGLFMTIGGLGFYFTPYIAVHNMEKAADDRDVETLSDYVDYPAFRESIKANFNAMMASKPDALPDRQRIVLESARLIKEAFLQQNAFSNVDSFCPMSKQLAMMDIIFTFHDLALKASETGKPVNKIVSMPVVEEINRMKEAILPGDPGGFEDLKKHIQEAFEG